MPIRTARKSKKIAKRRKSGFSWRKTKAAKRIKRKIRIILFAVLCLVFSAFLLVSFSLYKFIKAPLVSASFSSIERESSWDGKRDINVLFLRVDDLKKQNPLLLETAILNLSPESMRYAIISIPVENEIDLAQRYGKGSLSKAFALGNLNKDKDGILLVQRSIFKQMAIQLDSYILIDEAGVDSFSSIFNDIEFGDIKGTTSAMAIYLNPKFYSFLRQFVKTDLSVSEIFGVLSLVRKVNTDNSKVYLLDEDTFSTYKFFDNFWKSFNTSSYNENFRVLVLNAAQIPGLAAWGGRVVENVGLTLLDVSNSSTKYDTSFIVAKDVNSETVGVLSKVFGIKSIKSREELKEADNVFERGDIVVIVGVDIASIL